MQNDTLKFELIINGTPAEFGAMIKGLEARHAWEFPGEAGDFVVTEPSILGSESNPVVVRIGLSNRKPPLDRDFCWIRVERLPTVKDKSLLSGHYHNTRSGHLPSALYDLYGEMARLEYFADNAEAHKVMGIIGTPLATMTNLINRQHDARVGQPTVRLLANSTTLERVAAFILDFSTEYQLANHQVGAQVPVGGDGTLFDLYFYLRRALTDEEKIAHDIPPHIQNAETFDNQKCGTIRIKAGIVIGQVVLECNPLTDSAKQFVGALADRLRADQQDAQPAEPRVGNTRKDGKPNKGGRPPYVEDEWAFAELESGRPRNEVVKEWLEKTKASGREFADPQESFDKQMKAVRKRREKTARTE